MKEDGTKVDSLNKRISEMTEEITLKDAKIKSLNDRIETLLVASVEETQKRTQLQSQYELLEKSVQSLRSGDGKDALPPLQSSLMNTSALRDLLTQLQEKSDDLQLRLNNAEKECTMVSNRYSCVE